MPMQDYSHTIRSPIKPDDDRESWGFLHLIFGGDMEVEGWCIGYGNRERTTRVELETPLEAELEREVLKRLNEELRYCRDNGILLVVHDSLTIRKLRTRILYNDPDLGGGLRGVRKVALKQELLSQFSGLESDFSLIYDKVGVRVSPEEVDRHMSAPTAPDDEDARGALAKVLLLRELYLRVAKIADPKGNTYN